MGKNRPKVRTVKHVPITPSQCEEAARRLVDEGIRGKAILMRRYTPTRD